MPPKAHRAAPPPQEDDEQDVDMAEMLGEMGGLGMPMAKYMDVHFSKTFMASLPEKIRQRAEVLMQQHEEYVKLRKEMEKRETELQMQFEKEVAPLFQRRMEIVTGTGAPLTEEEVLKGFPSEHEGKVELKPEETEEAKGIPHFWVTALSNHVGVSSLIEEHDIEVLEHLIDVSCRTLDVNYGSRAIDFIFEPNEFFTNEKLTIELLAADESGEEVVKRTPVNWKSGKDVTVEHVTKKQKARGSGKVRTITREEPRESFFNLFKESADKDHDDEDEEEEEDHDEAVLSLVTVLFNNLVPGAVRHYTGEAPDGSSDVEEVEEDEEDFDDDNY